MGKKQNKNNQAHHVPVLDRHALYEQAVQSPDGDIAYIERFYRQYVSLGRPSHLREDFSGTAAICYAWCARDVCRTAVGVDLDGDALAWSRARHAGEAAGRVALLRGNVLQQVTTCTPILEAGAHAAHGSNSDQEPQRPQDTSRRHGQDTAAAAAAAAAAAGLVQQMQNTAHEHGCSTAAAAAAGQEGLQQLLGRPPDVVCAFNFSVFLLHKRSEVRQYFRQVRAALCGEEGGLLVMDVMGGATVEKGGLLLERCNPVTGASFQWEQARYNPVTRRLLAHIHLRCPTTRKVLRGAFTYDWRLWTLPDLVEALGEAGYSRVAVWVKPLRERSSVSRPVRGGAGSGGQPQQGCAACGMDAEGGQECSSEKEVEDLHARHTAPLQQHEDIEGEAEMDHGAAADDEEGVEEYVEYSAKTATPELLQALCSGWTGYLVGVVQGRSNGGS